MKRLRYKLIFVLVCFSLLLVMLNMLALNGAFERGFNRYLDQQRRHRIELLAQSLAELYRFDERWESLISDHRAWHMWLKHQSRLLLFKPPPKPELHYRAATKESSRVRGGIKDRGLIRGLQLLDKDQRLIYGPDTNISRHLIPVVVDQKIVAFLAYPHQTKLQQQIKKIFFKQQLHASLLTLLLAFILSLILAYFLARRLVRPIEQLSLALRAMANNQFNKRAQLRRGDELYELAQDTNRLSETLAQQQQAQQRWMSDMAHELRTPLSVLKAQLEALEDGVRQLDAAQLSLIKKETEYLNSLVEDMRALSHSELASMSYKWQPVDIKMMLEDAIKMWRQILPPEASIELKFTGSADTIVADNKRLRQLFHNLLQNSIRYTNAPAKILLSCIFTAEYIELRWEDSAPGVDDQHHQKIFERMYRVDSSRNRELRGVGIGLAICKNIVQAHQGEIFAGHSSLGGLAIVIRLFKS